MDSDLLSVMADISNQLELPKTELIDVKPDVPPNLTKIELETTGSELVETGSSELVFHKNPWTVPTLEDFLFYCCPGTTIFRWT